MGHYHALHDPAIDTIVLTPEQIQDLVVRLGRDIKADFAGKDLALVTILRGGVIFLADLCRAIDLPLTMDFMAISPYQHGSGVVRITKDLDDDITGRHVLIVEDIVDTGLTLNYLVGVLRRREPASLGVCTLLDKDVRRLVDLPIEYRGAEVPDRFVVGYGLDLGGRYRNLPFVASLHDGVMG